MSESKKIKTALISVYHKDGLDAIIAKLVSLLNHWAIHVWL